MIKLSGLSYRYPDAAAPVPRAVDLEIEKRPLRQAVGYVVFRPKWEPRPPRERHGTVSLEDCFPRLALRWLKA